MKKQIAKLLLFSGCLAIISTACTSKYPGFKKTDSGIYYKFLVKKEGARKPKKEEMMSINIVIKSADTVLIDSKKIPNDFTIPLSKSEYKGDINECLSMLGEGDSATFMINADSLLLKTFHQKELPKKIKKGSDITIIVKLKKIQTVEELKAAYMEKMKKLEEEESVKLNSYLTTNNITQKPSTSGLIYIEKKAGNGAKPAAGKKVKVNYFGALIDGTKFSSTEDGGKPYEFEIGKNQSIPGFEEGISMMKAGGKARFIIPSKLAYGNQGGGPIPPFATLVFDVELLDVK